MPDPKSDSPTALAQLLERADIEPVRARDLAVQTLDHFRTSGPGITYIGLNPDGLGDVWRRAFQAGHTQLTLEITASTVEGLTEHVNVRVAERDGDRPTEPPAPFSVPASWDQVVEQMRREGARAVDDWTSEADAENTRRDLN